MHDKLFDTANWKKFKQGEPEVAIFLEVNFVGNKFYASLVNFAVRTGFLTEKQSACVREKLPQEPREVHFDNVVAAFEQARNSLQKPILRINQLRFKDAPTNGKNPGCIYINRADQYLGKINPDGTFRPSSDCATSDLEELIVINQNPQDAIAAHGHATGECGACGRPLTDPKSVELGIGPICLQKWFS